MPQEPLSANTAHQVEQLLEFIHKLDPAEQKAAKDEVLKGFGLQRTSYHATIFAESLGAEEDDWIPCSLKALLGCGSAVARSEMHDMQTHFGVAMECS